MTASEQHTDPPSDTVCARTGVEEPPRVLSALLQVRKQLHIIFFHKYSPELAVLKSLKVMQTKETD